MKHPTAWPLLDHFLDGTLDNKTRWEVTAHLAECTTCQAYLAEQARMRAFVRDRLSRVTVPAELAGRIQTTLRETEPRQSLFRWPRFWLVPLVATSLALLLLVAISQGFLSSAPRGPDVVAEVATAYVLFAQDDNMLEIAGTQKEIQTWFQDKVSFPVMTPDLPEYTLLGGRLVVVNGQRAAQLIYENEPVEQYVSLIYFETPPSKQNNLKPVGLFNVGEYGDTTIVAWPSDQIHMALVADLPIADLLQLAEQIGNK